jgi:hypothetical protein
MIYQNWYVLKDLCNEYDMYIIQVAHSEANEQESLPGLCETVRTLH